jgi:hypothetical protein
MRTDMWTYQDPTLATMSSTGGDVNAGTADLTGFEVEARDGGIGKIDQASYEAGSASIVVDTGPWIFGKKRLLPAGVIETIDLDKRTVRVSCTKDQIKNAPDFDDVRSSDASYREQVGTHYSSM